jgi:hypothetical protein
MLNDVNRQVPDKSLEQLYSIYITTTIITVWSSTKSENGITTSQFPLQAKLQIISRQQTHPKMHWHIHFRN